MLLSTLLVYVTTVVTCVSAQAREYSAPTPVKGTKILNIPQIGLGTARITGNTSEVIATAIVNGFRHLDCAFAYGNQKDIGLGIREGLKRTGLKREDLWITSKLWNNRHGREDFAIKETLEQLQLDYLDLFLIHWPMNVASGIDIFDHVQTWKAMEKLVRPVQGTRFIGISNFNTTQVEEVLKVATIRPKYNEFEVHPYLPQEELVKAHTAYNISVIAYAPLGNTNPKHNLGVSARGTLAPLLLTNPVIERISKARGCKASQTVLAWNMARGLIVIPKASQSEHQKENIITLDKCTLTEKDVSEITALRVPLRLYENACSYGLTDGCPKKSKKF